MGCGGDAGVDARKRRPNPDRCTAILFTCAVASCCYGNGRDHCRIADLIGAHQQCGSWLTSVRHDVIQSTGAQVFDSSALTRIHSR